MASAQEDPQSQDARGGSGKLGECESYFEKIQSRNKLPQSLRETLTAAFMQIPVSSFPQVPRGKVIEIEGDALVADAVKILSENNILSAPVRNPGAKIITDWRDRYLGVIDYSSIILWVIENAEIAALALSAGSATAAGLGAGTVGALGAMAMGVTGPVAVVGLTAAAVGAAVVGGEAAEKGAGKDAPTAANNLGEDFYKVILQEEPFKSTMVKSITKSYRWAPFVPVLEDSSMLSVLLMLSKYRLRNVPVIVPGKPDIKNYITQSAVIHGLDGCRGRDWFEVIASHPITDLGLPFMSSEKVISVRSDELILEAFKRMKDNRIGGLPVVAGQTEKIIGNISIRDIRYLLLEPQLFKNFRRFTVMDFIGAVLEATQGKGKMVPGLTCQMGTTMGTVIVTLAFNSVHRIYVVSAEDEVMGVITLRDVISCFIYEPPDYFDDCLGFSVNEMLNQ